MPLRLLLPNIRIHHACYIYIYSTLLPVYASVVRSSTRSSSKACTAIFVSPRFSPPCDPFSFSFFLFFFFPLVQGIF